MARDFFRSQILKALILIGSALFFAACANWELKEKCEDTNWFEYSQQVAFSGKYVAEDRFIKDCRKVEMLNEQQVEQGFKLGHDKMCHYDEIFLRAKTGTPVFFNFCENLDPSEMRASYNLGLQIFCTPDKGYSFGKSGKIYSNICIAELEPDFLPPYHKGRKEYLQENILVTEKLVIALQDQVGKMKTSETQMSKEYASLPKNVMDCSYKSVYDVLTKVEKQKFVCEEASYIRQQRGRLSERLNQLRQQMSNVYMEIEKQNQNLARLKSDLSQVP